MITMPSEETMLRPARQKRRQYTQEELDTATPFGRIILEEMNRQHHFMTDLQKSLGVYRTTMMGMIFKPDWRVSLSQIWKIAEFFQVPSWTLLIRLYGQSREREVKAALLLDRFLRLGQNEQGLVITMIEALVKQQHTSPLTQEQEEAANRLLISPEMRRLSTKHQQEKEEEKEEYGG